MMGHTPYLAQTIGRHGERAHGRNVLSAFARRRADRCALRWCNTPCGRCRLILRRLLSALLIDARSREKRFGMAVDIVQFAAADVVEHVGEGPARRRGATPAVLARARAASAAIRAKATANANQVDRRGAELAAFCILGCAGMLGATSRGRHQSEVQQEAMLRLSMSHVVRGSGALVEKVRRLQNLSVALVAHSALGLQKQGLQLWLQRPARKSFDHRVFGVAIMWGEASQQLKPLLSRLQRLRGGSATPCHAPKDVQIMVVMGCAHLMEAHVDEAGGMKRDFQWQPWLAPPLFLEAATKPHLVEGLARTMPFDLTDLRDAGPLFEDGKTIVVVSLTFDYAASNVASFRHLASCAASEGRLLLHGERCATHCIHKAHCISAAQMAGALTISRNVDALAVGIAAHVRRSLDIRVGQPDQPSSMAELQEAVLQVLGIDGDMSFLDARGIHRAVRLIVGR